MIIKKKGLNQRKCRNEYDIVKYCEGVDLYLYLQRRMLIIGVYDYKGKGVKQQYSLFQLIFVIIKT